MRTRWMTVAIVAVAVVAATTPAAPRPKSMYPDVVVGKEFFLPWPPVETYPPSHHLRIVAIDARGVDVRRINGQIEGRLAIDYETGKAYVAGVDSEVRLLTIPEVQALVDLRHPEHP